MKDRIRQIMESQHMNQQSFAAFIGIAPASLSSILQERTRPTLNTVEAIMSKMPQINLSWLISGAGDMYAERSSSSSFDSPVSPSISTVSEPMLDFDPTDNIQAQPKPKEIKTAAVEVKNIDNQHRTITEIRVFFDDQTWESFVPKK